MARRSPVRILPPAALRDLETPRPGLPFAKPVAAAPKPDTANAAPAAKPEDVDR